MLAAFDPESDKVFVMVDDEIPEVQVEYTWVEFFARNFVMEHLHPKGVYHKFVTGEEWKAAYLLCDGYGTLDRDWIDRFGVDWSHVRDSSKTAYIRVANYLSELHWAISKIEEQARVCLEACKENQADPLEVIAARPEAHYQSICLK